MSDPYALSPNSLLPPRSIHLIHAIDSVLLVVDVQEKLFPKIQGNGSVIAKIRQLVLASKILGIPTLATEQVPEKLGQTVSELASLLPDRQAKRMFSCREWIGEWESRLDDNRKTMVVCGIESHVCILQTALDFLSLGWKIVIPCDAIGSQSLLDHETAIRRMESHGASIVTCQGLIFEWAGTSAHPHFRELSSLFK